MLHIRLCRDDDVCSILRSPQGNGKANAAGGTGDEQGATFQSPVGKQKLVVDGIDALHGPLWHLSRYYGSSSHICQQKQTTREIVFRDLGPKLFVFLRVQELFLVVVALKNHNPGNQNTEKTH